MILFYSCILYINVYSSKNEHTPGILHIYLTARRKMIGSQKMWIYRIPTSGGGWYLDLLFSVPPSILKFCDKGGKSGASLSYGLTSSNNWVLIRVYSISVLWLLSYSIVLFQHLTKYMYQDKKVALMPELTDDENDSTQPISPFIAQRPKVIVLMCYNEISLYKVCIS